MLDIPHIYSKTPEGIDFIYALKNTDLSNFALPSVQIIIDSQLDYWGKVNAYYIGLPMTVQLVVFWYWSNIVLFNLPKNDDVQSSFQTQHDVCRVILCITAFYLLAIEITALVDRKWKYFLQVTRLLNVITPLLLLLNVFSNRDSVQ